MTKPRTRPLPDYLYSQTIVIYVDSSKRRSIRGDKTRQRHYLPQRDDGVMQEYEMMRCLPDLIRDRQPEDWSPLSIAAPQIRLSPSGFHVWLLLPKG